MSVRRGATGDPEPPAARPPRPVPPSWSTPDPAERERERAERLRSLDERIGDALRESEARGELQRAPSWGRAMQGDDGFDETPVEWRLPFKILKDAGMAPPEIETMREITELQRQAVEATTADARERALCQLADKRQHLALRLERYRAGWQE